MIYPIRILVLMALTLAVVAGGCALAYTPLAAAFASNAAFHGAILAMLAIGVVAEFAQTAALVPATRWIERTRRGFAAKEPPEVIAPVATVLAGHEREGFTLSMLAMRSLLEAVEARLKQARDVPHFLIALIIALGIAGALWPLAAAPDARLQPASLLLGLAGAVVLGVLHLQFRHAQNAFLDELQSFLSQRTQLPSALLGGEGTLPRYTEALLKEAAESLVDLERLMIGAEEDRRSTQEAVNSLVEALAELSDQLRAQQKVMTAISKNNSDLLPAIHDFASQLAAALAGAEELRTHVRKIDVSLARLADEMGGVRGQGIRPSRAA